MVDFNVVNIPAGSLHKDEQTHAFFYSKDYETIFGHKMKDSQKVTRYLKITNAGKEKRPVYLQYEALSGMNQGEIALSYENACNLSVDAKGNDVVAVEPISKYSYYWHTFEPWGQIGFCVSIVSLILSVISLCK